MENLDVITIGEAMAMFVATETGDLAEVEHFMKRCRRRRAERRHRPGAPGPESRLGEPRRQR